MKNFLPVASFLLLFFATSARTFASFAFNSGRFLHRGQLLHTDGKRSVASIGAMAANSFPFVPPPSF
jgi:hypothetical protein